MSRSHARIRARKETFDAAHADCLNAIRRRDLSAVARAIRRENAVIAEQARFIREARALAGLPARRPARQGVPADFPPISTTPWDRQTALRTEAVALRGRALVLERSFTRPVIRDRAAILRRFIEERLAWLNELDPFTEPPPSATVFDTYVRRLEELEAVLIRYGPEADLRQAAHVLHGRHG